MAKNNKRNNEFLYESPSTGTLVRSSGVELTKKLDLFAPSSVKPFKITQGPVQVDIANKDHYVYSMVMDSVNLALQYYITQTKLTYEFVEIEKASLEMLGRALVDVTFKATGPNKELTTFEAEVFLSAATTNVWRVKADGVDGKVYFDRPKKELFIPKYEGKLFSPRPDVDDKLFSPCPTETLIRSSGVKMTKVDPNDLSYVKPFKITQGPVQVDISNKDHYIYSMVMDSVNLALQYYITQTKLIYEFVEVEKASLEMLGGALVYVTFKATGPNKELTTFEAEVFRCADRKDVWRVMADGFDGKVFNPKPNYEVFFPKSEGKLFSPYVNDKLFWPDVNDKLSSPIPVEDDKLFFPKYEGKLFSPRPDGDDKLLFPRHEEDQKACGGSSSGPGYGRQQFLENGLKYLDDTLKRMAARRTVVEGLLKNIDRDEAPNPLVSK